MLHGQVCKVITIKYYNSEFSETIVNKMKILIQLYKCNRCDQLCILNKPLNTVGNVSAIRFSRYLVPLK